MPGIRPGRFRQILDGAKKRKGTVTLIDCDVSLLTSMTRVLATRTPYGEDPCVPPEAIRSGIKPRAWLVEKVINDPLIDYYDLFHTDDKGNNNAMKRGTVFTVLSKGLFDACCIMPLRRK